MIIAPQFPLLFPIFDLFEGDLRTFLPRTATPILLIASVFFVLWIHSIRFRNRPPIIWPPDFTDLCRKHHVTTPEVLP